MKTVLFLAATFCLLAVARAQTEPVISSVQQALKDQGFYYGEVTGRKDADTTAAIRRYQIRNGLQITGELNAETQKSLGVKGAISAPPRATPAPTPRVVPTPNRSNDLRDDRPVQQQPLRPPVEEGDDLRAQPPGDESFGPRGFEGVGNLFEGTPYANASPETQRRVIFGAQSLLARRGYYRSALDGEFGPGTQFAVRAFQSRFGMEPNGRLDMRTLGALGLLPGQRLPGVTAPVGRGGMRPATVTPNGEPIYTPR